MQKPSISHHYLKGSLTDLLYFRTMRLLLLYVSLLLLATSATAQNKQQKMLSIPFKSINQRQGLPNTIIRDLIKDRNGYIWMATVGGLIRYDGSRFEVFKHQHNDSTSIASSMLMCIAEDKNGKLICTTAKGISFFNSEKMTFKNYPLRYSDSSAIVNVSVVQMLIIDERLFLSTSGDVVEYNFKTHLIHSVYGNDSVMKDGYVWLKYDHINKRLWLASVKGLSYYDLVTDKYISPGKKPEILNTNHCSALLTDNNNILWYYNVTDSTINNINLKTFDQKKKKMIRTTPSLKAPYYFNEAVVDSKNNLWLCNWQSQPLYYNTKEEQLYTLKTNPDNPNSLASDFITVIYEDADHTTWFGTDNGVSITSSSLPFYEPHLSKTEFPELAKTYSSLNIYSFCDNDSILYYAFEEGGFVVYDRVKDKSKLIPAPYNKTFQQRIYTMADDGTNIWCGTRGGIWLFNKRNETFTRWTALNSDSLFNTNAVVRIYKDSQNRMWLSNQEAGLYYYDLSQRRLQHFSDMNITAAPVTCMAEDKKGNMWLGHANGFSCIDAKKQTVTNYFLSQEEFQITGNAKVRAIYIDSNNHVWMSIYKFGLVEFDPSSRKKKFFTESDGLPTVNINDINSDDQDNLLLLCAPGVIRWNIKTGETENLNIDFGQKYIEPLCFHSSYKSKLLIGFNGAYAEFDKRISVSTSGLSKVNISLFNVIYRKQILNNDSIRLGRKENNFSIGYSVLESAYRKDIEYQYMLEGFDKDWIDAGTQKYAAYTNVPGGNYIFKVRARITGTTWKDNISEFYIHIDKWFYMTWWFRISLLFLMFAIIRLFMRYREENQQESLEEEIVKNFTTSQYPHYNTTEIARDLVQNVLMPVGFKDTVVYVYDENEGRFVPKATSGKVKNTVVLEDNNIGEDHISLLASKKNKLIRKDIIKGNAVYSDITVPVIHNGRLIGMIQCIDSRNRGFRKRQQYILDNIASISADKIFNALSQEELHLKEEMIAAYDRKNVQLQLTALRAQMNPHFIFNSLNSIDSFIITKEPAVASVFLGKFSRLIRLILNQSDRNTITLDTEIEMLTNYIELEQLRFEDPFHFEIKATCTGDVSDILIPSMIIQPFVENAILHGLMNRNKSGGELFISFVETSSALLCTITDNGVGRAGAMEIKNKKINVYESKAVSVTEKRLSLLQQQAYREAEITITDLYPGEELTGTKVYISIPL